MDKILLKLTLVLFFLLAAVGLNRVYAASTPHEYHADARMSYRGHGPVASTHGYLRVISDSTGIGLVDVMFSNGNPTLRALFNARVRFLSAAGRVLREAHFNCRLGGAGEDGASECKVTQPLSRTAFDSIQVDFYLSDMPRASVVALN